MKFSHQHNKIFIFANQVIKNQEFDILVFRVSSQAINAAAALTSDKLSYVCSTI